MMAWWAHDLFDDVFGAEKVDGALGTIKYYDEEEWKAYLDEYYEKNLEKYKQLPSFTYKVYRAYVNTLVGIVDKEGIIHLPEKSYIHMVAYELLHRFSEIIPREKGISTVNSKGGKGISPE